LQGSSGVINQKELCKKASEHNKSVNKPKIRFADTAKNNSNSGLLNSKIIKKIKKSTTNKNHTLDKSEVQPLNEEPDKKENDDKKPEKKRRIFYVKFIKKFL